MYGSTAIGRTKREAALKWSGGLLALLVAALGLMGMNATQASAAEDQGFIFNEGRISLGDLKGLEIIDPATDDPATLSGQLEGTEFTAPKGGFVFPDKTLEDVDADLLMVDIVAKFSAADDIEGTFDRTTGELDITQFPLQAEFNIYMANTQSKLATCSLTGVPVLLNSNTSLPGEGDATFDGAPFLPEGAAATTWSSLPEVTGDALCSMAAGLLGGPGGLWLAGESTTDPLPVVVVPTKAPVINTKPGAETTETDANFTFGAAGDETQPVNGFDCKIDQDGWVPCNDGTAGYNGLTLGSHSFSVRANNQAGTGPEASYSWTITEKKPNPPKGKPNFGKLTVKANKKVVKRGKKVVVTVKIKNTGKAVANNVKFCVNAPARLVKVKKCQTVGKLKAGKNVTRKFNVQVKKRARKGAKVVLKFQATAKNVKKKTGKVTVRTK